MKRTLFSFAAAMLLAVSASAQQAIPQFQAGERVAFIGDSITHGGHYHSYIWLYYMTRFPNMPLYFFNCGVGGDTADSMDYRLASDVLAKDPTYMTLTFGMNDSGYWDTYNREDTEELSNKKVEASLKAFDSIVAQMKSWDGEADIVMIGGSPYDETSRFNNDVLVGKNAAICRIIDRQKEVAGQNGWGFVDFNAPMVEIAEAEQVKDSTFCFSRQDRIHPDQDGQMVMAYLFLKAQGLAGRKVAQMGINARRAKVMEQEYCKVTSLEKGDGCLSFDYLAESLPYPCDSISEHGWANIRSQKDAMALIPFMEEFNQEILRVEGLEEGTYKLTIDGTFIDDLTADQLSEGVNLAAYVNTPQYRQASAIMYMNEERLEMEKRMREYVWMHTNMFRGTDQIYVDDDNAINAITKEVQNGNWFVAMSNYWYRKNHFPEIRQLWQNYMDEIVATIYKVNKPEIRHFSLEKQ